MAFCIVDSLEIIEIEDQQGTDRVPADGLQVFLADLQAGLFVEDIGKIVHRAQDFVFHLHLVVADAQGKDQIVQRDRKGETDQRDKNVVLSDLLRFEGTDRDDVNCLEKQHDRIGDHVWYYEQSGQRNEQKRNKSRRSCRRTGRVNQDDETEDRGLI